MLQNDNFFFKERIVPLFIREERAIGVRRSRGLRDASSDGALAQPLCNAAGGPAPDRPARQARRRGSGAGRSPLPGRMARPEPQRTVTSAEINTRLCGAQAIPEDDWHLTIEHFISGLYRKKFGKKLKDIPEHAALD